MNKIIDKYLDEIVTLGLNKRPIKIEPEMSSKNSDSNKEWNKWFPIKSTVNDIDLNDLELEIGYKLPLSYREFLKYKHFYELQIGECTFCSHPIRKWKDEFNKFLYDGYPSEDLIETGRIPFANWSDWGLLCFDTTQKCNDNDYPIVLWDHEAYDEFEIVYDNFITMISELDESLNNE